MKLRFGDFIVFALVCALAVGSLLAGMGSTSAGGDVRAEIYQGGKLVRTIGLSALTGTETFDLDGDYHNKLVAEQGRIRYETADCPDLTCVHTGWITRPGQIAACVPNKTLVKIVGGASEQDVVIR